MQRWLGFPRFVLVSLLTAVAFLLAAFLSDSRAFSEIAFGLGDLLFTYALHSGILVSMFGSAGEKAHHEFQLLVSLVEWWVIFAVLFLIVGLVGTRAKSAS